jgi:diadenosine tetraphosphate (Ap4A) HIT family hydrolase
MSDKKCLFCDKTPNRHQIIMENELFYSRWDDYPVSEGHSEVVPKKHIKSFFHLTKKEVEYMYDLIKKTKEIIDKKYHPDSYNIGINEGIYAGRTIDHLHIHIIPRYKGDVDNPKGGIRNVIPGKGSY